MLRIYLLVGMPLLLLVAQVNAVGAESTGQADLDKAIELQLGAQSLDDLQKVIQLCESALKKGIEKENEPFAKQLLSSVLYERASQVAQALVEGRLPTRRSREFRQQALDDLQNAVKHNPTFGDAYILSAKLHTLPGGNREAGIKAATEAMRCFEDDKAKRSQALVFRAQLQESPEQQLADFDEAIKLDPESAEAWLGRAMLHLNRDEFQKAVEGFEKLLKDNANNPLAHTALAEALLNLNKVDEALPHADKAIELRPDIGVTYLLRARIKLLKEDDKAALEDLDQALTLEPQDVNALLLRARVHQTEGNLAKAKSDVNRILQLRPGAEPALLLRSIISFSEGRMVEAIDDVEGLVKQSPKNSEWRLHLGTLYVADGRPRKAVQIFTELLADDKESWLALKSRADALLTFGQHQEAISDYEEALKLIPEDVGDERAKDAKSGILNNLAWVLATSTDDGVRNANRSLELATKACEVTKYEQPHIISTLAAAYAEMGDFESARKWSSKSVEMGKDELKEQLRKELESYQQEKPWREMQNVEEKPDPVAKAKNAVDT